MKNIDIKQLRKSISEFTQPSDKTAILLFFLDFTIYAIAIMGIIFMENIALRILCAILAGLKIASIFVIAHDAAHDSFIGDRLLNKIIARITFLPVLHNYSLWLIVHNRLHHQAPNVKGINSWSPVSRQEYEAMPIWRKVIEHFYRCPVGIWFNYMIERWWKNKFYPYKNLVGERKLIHWLDFTLVLGYLTAYLSLLNYAGNKLAHTNTLELITLALILPIIVGFFMIGFTVYQQHTHETIPWFKTQEEKESLGYGQEDVTMHVQYPDWYNMISHNAMEHTVHHVDPRVPTYNLAKAQRVLKRVLGDQLITIPFSLKGFLQTMRVCKLYDYENHHWLDFNGSPTTGAILTGSNIDYANAA